MNRRTRRQQQRPRKGPPRKSPLRRLGYTALTGDTPEIPSAEAEQRLSAMLRDFSFKQVCGRAAHLMARRSKNQRQFSEELRKSGFDPRVYFRPYLVQRLILAAAEHCGDDLSGNTMDAAQFQRALDLCFQFVAHADRRATSIEDAEAMWLRLQQDQIHDLVSYRYYTRELLIALQAADYARGSGVDLDTVYSQKYGCSFTETVLMALAFWGAVTKDGEEGFFQKLIVNSTGPRRLPLSKEAPDAFRRLVSRTAAGLREQFSTTAIKDYEIYSPSPLKWFPIVEHADGEFSVPIANDLLDRPVRLFYEDASGSMDGPTLSTLSNAIGRAYSEHVRASLAAIFGSANVLEADRSLPTIQGRKVCDFICVGRSPLVFVEVKSTRLSAATYVTKEARAFAREAQKRHGLSYALDQVCDSILTYREQPTKLPQRRDCVGLLIVAGENVGLNTAHVRREVEAAMASASVPRYEIADDLGLDAMTARGASGLPIDSALWRKFRDTTRRFHDTHTYFTPDAGLPPHPLDEEYAARRTAFLSSILGAGSDLVAEQQRPDFGTDDLTASI